MLLRTLFTAIIILFCSSVALHCQQGDDIPLSVLDNWVIIPADAPGSVGGNSATQIRNATRFTNDALRKYRLGNLKGASDILNSAFGNVSYQSEAGVVAVRAGIKTNQGLCYYELHYFEAAEKCFKDALALRRRLSKGDGDSTLASVLEHWGAFRNNMDSLNDAGPALMEAMAIRWRISGGRPDWKLAMSLYNAGIFHNRSKNYAAADSLFEQSLAMVRALDSASGGATLARLLERTAAVQQRRGRYRQAEAGMMEALALWSRAPKHAAHPDIVRGLGMLGTIRDSLGDYSGTDSCYLQALRYARRLSKKNDSVIAGCLAMLGNFRARHGYMSEAEKFLAEAVKTYRKVYKNQPHLELARALASLGRLHEQQDDYARAEEPFRTSLEMYRDLYSRLDGYEHAAVYVGLGHALHGQGKNTEGARAYREALKMYRNPNRFGSRPNPLVAGLLVDLGRLYIDRGNYSVAESYFADGIDMYTALRMDGDDTGYARAIRYAARYYHQRGDLEKGENMLLEALSIFRGRNTHLHDRQIAGILVDLSAIRMERGDLDGAITQLEQARGIFDSLYKGGAYFDLAKTLNGLAGMYLQKGRYGEAGPVIERAMNMYGRLCGKQDHPDRAAAIANKGLYLALAGDRGNADAALDESRSMYERLHKKNGHPDLVFGIHTLARYAQQGRLDAQAMKCYKKLIWMLPRMMREASLFEGEDEQIRFQKRLSQISSSLLTFFLQAGEPGELFNAALWAKGRVLSAVEWRNGIIAELRKTDPDIDSLWLEIRKLRLSLSDTYVPTEPHAREKWKSTREAALARTELAEGNLAKRIARIKKKKGHEDSWSGAAKKLRAGECAVEFIRIPYMGAGAKEDSAVYYALVLRPSLKGWGIRPELVRMCTEADLQSVLRSPVGHFSVDDESYVHDAGALQKMYELVWQPISSKLKGSRRIYLSTDGLLNKVSFVSLESEQDKLLDLYDIRQLFSTRDLLAARTGGERRTTVPKTAVLFGAVKFSADSAELAGESMLMAEGDDSGEYPLYEALPYRRDNSPDSIPPLPRDGIFGEPLPPLAGTRPEVDSIGGILRQQDYIVTTYVGAQATEERFIALRSPSVLHVATHGAVFSSPKESPQEIAVKQEEGGIRMMEYAENPLFRSLLLLAGADRVWTLQPPFPHVADGVVTAYDVAHMSLSGTELVVLSACETGLGEIMPGEGVFGLKRSFRAAGAGAVIISLWKVPDQQTRQLMELFYQNWLEKTMEKPQALAEAQKAMKAKSDDPYYWGAFVLVGE